MNLIVGIDPGKKGGLCFLNCKNNKVEAVLTMPDPCGFVQIMKKFKNHIQMVFLEKQWAFKGQGHVSAFTLGTHYGFIKGVLQAFKISYVEISPQSWIYFFFNRNGIKGRKIIKQMSLIKVKELFPDLNLTHDGQSDAVLIAKFGEHLWYSGCEQEQQNYLGVVKTDEGKKKKRKRRKKSN